VRLGRDAKIELLRSVPLFAGCSKSELRKLALNADEIDLRSGYVFVREGRTGREFFVLVEGSAEVTAKGKKLADLKGGDWFGEIALGLALVLGLFTRLAALVAIFVLFNYWYVMGGSPVAAPGTPQIVKHMAFGLAVVFLTAAGRAFGLDRMLHQKFPRNPLF